MVVNGLVLKILYNSLTVSSETDKILCELSSAHGFCQLHQAETIPGDSA
jgi:hypothetical protein